MATFDYTSRDYLSIRQDLINRAARVLPDWDGADASEFANVFVDLWAYMGDVLHFYIDRAAAETFLETATQRESIMAIANLMDYVTASPRSARGTIVLKLTAFPTGQTTYTVPQYTTFSAYDSDNNVVDMYLNSSVTLTSVGAQATGQIVQGTIIQGEAVGTSSGRPNQQFTLMKKNVDVDSITVQVNEGPLVSGSPSLVTYQYTANLSTANYVDKVFTTKATSDGYTVIIFGNGYNGAIPSTNANVVVSYRTTLGADGNLPANSIRFVNGLPASYVEVVSSGALSGGSDQESIESIRSNVSRLYRTQDRAVSLQDYKDLCLQIPGVSRTTAEYGPNNSITVNGMIGGSVVTFSSGSIPHRFVAGQKVTITDGDNASYRGTNLVIASVPTATTFTISTYSPVPTGSTLNAVATASSTVVLYPVPHQSSYPPAPITASSVQKVVIEIPTPMAESVESYFSTRSMLGVTALVIDPPNHGTIDKYIECTPVYVGMIVHVKSTYVQSWVKEDVITAVKNLLSFQNVYFGQTLTIGEVYRAALNVQGVDYVEITNLSTTYDSTPATVSTVANVVGASNKLLCFTDDMTSAPYSVNLSMVGGITGSN